MRLPYPSLCVAGLKVHWAAAPKTPLCWHTKSKHFNTNNRNSCGARLKMHWSARVKLCVTYITSNCIRMPYPSLCIACLKVQRTAVSKLLLCWEHSKHFPTSPLGQYCAGSLLLNFGSQKRSGVLIRKERSNLCAAHLKMQWSAGFKMCNVGCLIITPLNFWKFSFLLGGVSIPIVNSWNPMAGIMICNIW